MTTYERELAVAIAAAKEAGALLRIDFHRPGGPRGAGSHADADLEAEKIIRDRLLAATSWSYLGEETGAVTGSDPSYCWAVDPNDGTAAYLRGHRGSAVSIGLLRGGIPVLGVVFSFAHPDDDGDLIAWAEGCGPISRNGVPVTTSLADGKLDRGGIVFVSQDGDRNPEANAKCVAPARFVAMPSIAYRLALTAVGAGVAAVSLSSPTSWDYAAGHALVMAAGGVLLDAHGEPIAYTRDGRSSSGGRVFGGAPAAVAALVERPWNQALSKKAAVSGPFPLARLEPGRAIEDAEMLRRAQGCLLGQVAGDNLGSLVEFRSASSIRASYPNGVRNLADGGTWNLIAGQPTDDSELALMLARALVASDPDAADDAVPAATDERDDGDDDYRDWRHGFGARHGSGERVERVARYDPGAALEAYAHWYRSHPFDIGSTTSAALGAAARGKTRDERLKLAARGARRDSQANGSLMRISPLGIFGWRDPRQAAESAREDSRLTHPNAVPVEACACYVAAIATAIGKKTGPRETYLAGLAEAERGGNKAVIDALHAAGKALPAKMDGPEQGWVLLALQAAFYELLHAPTLESGVVEVVSQGGDADTTGAILGALLGAVHGRDAIPARWRRAVLSCRPMKETGAVHPRPTEFWPVDVLVLAEQLLDAGRTG